CCFLILCVFFFQAEDGIRDRNVTVVQTCALPIFTGALGSAVFVYPYLYSITQENWIGIFVGGIMMSGAMYSAANAVWPSFYSEMFPVRVRATGLALGTQIGFAL